MTFQPLYDRVLLQKRDASSSTGIVLVADDHQKQFQALVIRTGAGRILDDGSQLSPTVRPGDVVLVSSMATLPVDLDGEKFLIARDGDILGIVSKGSV